MISSASGFRENTGLGTRSFNYAVEATGFTNQASRPIKDFNKGPHPFRNSRSGTLRGSVLEGLAISRERTRVPGGALFAWLFELAMPPTGLWTPGGRDHVSSVNDHVVVGAG